MNAEQKQRALTLLDMWRSSKDGSQREYQAAILMAALLQELADESGDDPVLVVETEPGYWNRGHYNEGTKSYIDPTRVWRLPVGTKLYTSPPGVTYIDEPVGYLYTNVRSGEYHVSDYDDDYRGPERVLWCIEPVYRRAKGQS